MHYADAASNSRARCALCCIAGGGWLATGNAAEQLQDADPRTWQSLALQLHSCRMQTFATGSQQGSWIPATCKPRNSLLPTPDMSCSMLHQNLHIVALLAKVWGILALHDSSCSLQIADLVPFRLYIWHMQCCIVIYNTMGCLFFVGNRVHFWQSHAKAAAHQPRVAA